MELQGLRDMWSYCLNRLLDMGRLSVSDLRLPKFANFFYNFLSGLRLNYFQIKGVPTHKHLVWWLLTLKARLTLRFYGHFCPINDLSLTLCFNT